MLISRVLSRVYESAVRALKVALAFGGESMHAQPSERSLVSPGVSLIAILFCVLVCAVEEDD